MRGGVVDANRGLIERLEARIAAAVGRVNLYPWASVIMIENYTVSGESTLPTRLYELRPMYWEAVHNGRPISKEGVRILFDKKKAELLFQGTRLGKLMYIPSNCTTELLVTAPRDSLPLINRVREYNGLSPATMPAPKPRNLNRHEWNKQITANCERSGCRTLGMHFCLRCGLKACNKHKNKTGCST